MHFGRILGIEFFAYRFLPPGDTYFYFSIPVETAFNAASVRMRRGLLRSSWQHLTCNRVCACRKQCLNHALLSAAPTQADAPQDPTANVHVFVSSQYKVLSFSNWLQNDIMKRWAPPKNQWRVDVVPDEDRKMKARHTSKGSDVFDFLRAADPGVSEMKEPASSSSGASSPKSGSSATTPKRGKGVKLHAVASSPGLLSSSSSSSSSSSTAAVDGALHIKKVWRDRGYEGYVIAACIMNEVNSMNVKHRPYAQV